MSKADQAVQCLHSGYNCSQAILSTYCTDFGLCKNTALQLSCGFGAGMGRLGETCGAVTGAYLLIGLIYGACEPEDAAAKEKTYALIQEFSRRFAERNQSTICRELLGFDFRSDISPKASERVKAICPKLVQDAAEILEELLNL